MLLVKRWSGSGCARRKIISGRRMPMREMWMIRGSHDFLNIMKDFFIMLAGLFRLKPVDTAEASEIGVMGVMGPMAAPEALPGIDARSLRNIRTLDVKFQKQVMLFLLEAKKIAAMTGCDYVIIGGTRTWAEQNALYAQSRTKPGPRVTNAKGGESNHNYGIAFDGGVFRGGAYLDDVNPRVASSVHKACSEAAKKHGLAWGGYWRKPDEPHYQLASVPASPTAAMRLAYQTKGSVIA